MISLLSIKTNNLSKKMLRDILLLKKTHYKYSFESQLKHFKKNYKKNDLHNLLLYNKKLIGYTALRRTKIKLNKKLIHIFLFDALIIKNKFRKLLFSSILMNFNNYIIKKNKKISTLKCNINMVAFYQKFGWLKKNIKIKSISNDNKKNMFFNLCNLH